MTDPMTSAERPTQEVAPRTEAGRRLLSKASNTDGWHTNFDAGDIVAIEGEAWKQGIEATQMERAEASRSAPPAAVTPLLEWIEEHGEVEGDTISFTFDGKPAADEFAAAILSKITPAQPSASSEGEGTCPWCHGSGKPTHPGDIGNDEACARCEGSGTVAAKPTGSADEPLLRAAVTAEALGHVFYELGVDDLSLPDARSLAERVLRRLPTVQATYPSHNSLRVALERIAAMGHTDEHKGWDSGPYCTECEDIDAAVDEARAALASAEPAEVDGDAP